MSTPERELDPAEALRAEREAELDADLGAELGAEIDAETDPDAETPELSIAFSPRQILGGFALLAALIVLLFRRRRGKSKDG